MEACYRGDLCQRLFNVVTAEGQICQQNGQLQYHPFDRSIRLLTEV